MVVYLFSFIPTLLLIALIDFHSKFWFCYLLRIISYLTNYFIKKTISNCFEVKSFFQSKTDTNKKTWKNSDINNQTTNYFKMLWLSWIILRNYLRSFIPRILTRSIQKKNHRMKIFEIGKDVEMEGVLKILRSEYK